MHNLHSTSNEGERGYIALVSVLIAGGLLLLVGMGSATHGVDSLNAASGEESALRARLLADACAEDALMKLKSNLGYNGNESIIVEGSDTCKVLPLLGTGNLDRVILTQGVDAGYVRNVRVDIAQVNPLLVIRTWTTVP